MFHSLFYFTLHVPGILFTVAVLTSIFTAEKSSIKTVPKEALLFTRIYYFPALIFAFIVFSFLVRPAAGNFLFTQYNSTGGYDFLKQASFADPFNARYHYERGLYFEKNGNLRTAVPFYENALKYDRLNCLYRLHLARAYSGLGDYAEADRNYALALRAAPYRAFTYSEYADFNLVKLNNVEKAQDMLAAAIRIEPYYAGASANLASIYWSQKNYGLALKEYDSIENAISIYTPVNDYERNLLFAPPGAIYRNKALLLMEMGKKNDSCSYYSRSLGLNMPPNAALEAYCGGSSSK
jgi:tetratricopeptide (TPR) repeat protein